MAAVSANIPAEMAPQLIEQWQARGYALDVVLYKKWPHSRLGRPARRSNVAFAALPDRFPSVLSLDFRADEGDYEDEDNLYLMHLLRRLGRYALIDRRRHAGLLLLRSAATLPYAQAAQQARAAAREQSKNVLRRLPVGVRDAAGLTGEANHPYDFTAVGPLNTMPDTAFADFGPVRVYFGEKTGKYPDGNQVVVRGRDAMAVFDTPQVANRIREVLAAVDLAILGHVHEDHMAGLHRCRGKPVHVHEADLQAAQSWRRPVPPLRLPAAGAGRPAAQDRGRLPLRAAARRASVTPTARSWDLGGVRVRAVHLPGHTAGPLRAAGRAARHRLHRRHRPVQLRPVLRRRHLQPGRLPALAGAAARSCRRTCWITSHHKGVVQRPRGSSSSALHAFAARIDEREARLLQMLAARAADAGRAGAPAAAVPAARTTTCGSTTPRSARSPSICTSWSRPAACSATTPAAGASAPRSERRPARARGLRPAAAVLRPHGLHHGDDGLRRRGGAGGAHAGHAAVAGAAPPSPSAAGCGC